MKFWLSSSESTVSSSMREARRTLRPAKAQQRPERFWSVTIASGMRSETEVSIEAMTRRSTVSFSTSVVATALPATRAAGSALTAALRVSTQAGSTAWERGSIMARG